MIKALFCAILIGTACQATAGTLYKWAEADGSITFSPAPPAAGIAYDTVETGNKSVAAQRPITGQASEQTVQPAAQQAPVQSAAQSAMQTPQQSLRQQQTQFPTVATTPAVPQQPAQKSTYVPSPRAAALAEGIAWEQDRKTSADQVQEPVKPKTDLISSTRKSSQCLELEKRVVSLERRLRSKLSPDEVDNTVVAIVRYQSNFDKFCG